ncbi:MAG: hypothetical protein ACE5EN_00555 [Nitrospinota bacterium]
MKISIQIVASVLLIFSLFQGCTKKGTVKLPDKPPAEVVARFYGLLAEGGKLSIREALTMASTRFRVMDQNDFRRWTESFSKETKYKVLETHLPTAPTKDGDWIASVTLEVKTPSTFEDYFITTSKVHLILDKENNEWKIDFMGDSVDESDFLNAPAEARVEEEQAKKND